jgi:methionine-gamma-lyase
MDNTNSQGFNTQLVHAGDYEDMHGSVITPIYQTSTFKFKNAKHGGDCFAGRCNGYIYTRIGNPTIDALENKLAQLENGYRGIAFSSGMAAVSTVYMALLGQNKHIVSTDAVYGPSRAILERDFSRFGVRSSFVKTTDLDAVRQAIRPDTALLYIETPTNPTIEITDIAAVAQIAHEQGIPVCVDNTFCSPYTQKPLDLGADIVLHSVTKFINGHADVIGGAVIAKEETMYKTLRQTMLYLGGNMDPHQAYLTSRGIKTLALRMDKSQTSAMRIAQYLEKHPKVASVTYPGLPSHPQYELARRQMTGFGTMMSFELKDGFHAGETLMNCVKLCILAVSLGGVETLIQHPASMTHAGLSAQTRYEAGITDGMVRFSVGIEDCEDIIADIDNALTQV